MIKITNGVTTKEVSKGVFENIYSHMGYNVVTSKKPEVVVNKEDKEENKDNNINDNKTTKVEEKEKSVKSFSRSSK